MDSQVEIVMGTYNGSAYLKEMLDSLLNQTHPHWRLLIRDDGSNDDSLQMIHSFAQQHPDRISLLSSAQRLGVVGNFSKLLMHATAPYVMLADQDDVWFPEKIQKSLSLMKQMEKVHGKETPLLVHTDLKVVDRSLKLIHPSFWHYSHLDVKGHSQFRHLLIQNNATGCTMLLNRSLLQSAVPIAPAACMHDWWIALVASALGKIGYLSEPTMLYRQHGANEVGALSYGLKGYIHKWRQKGFVEIRKRRTQRFQQAQAFRLHYEAVLDREQLKTLEAFEQFSKTHLVNKLRLMVQHGFYKTGLLRNLIELL